MNFKQRSDLLKETVGLTSEPIAVTFTIEDVGVPDHGKVAICEAIKKAASGESFVIDAKHSACPGGSWHCGLTPEPSGKWRRLLQRFLTGGEKLTHTVASFQRMIESGTPPPTGMADRILMGPLEKAERRPDLVVFVCNPEQACRLLWLDVYFDGIQPRIEMLGSLCHATLSYSIMTGNTNLNLADWTARRAQKFPRDVVFLTVPYERMDNLIAAIPLCSAGTAELEYPPEFER